MLWRVSVEVRRVACMHGPAWWQRGAIYQIYPRSFADSNGDGIGDLQGIREHLDYLANLNVEGIWLSPIYPSPMADFGYDVSDYRDVDPIFGTLADLDRLVEDCHTRNLRVILDWVPNHTSDQHPWFVESRSSRANPKRDWYVWRDGAIDGGPPNDWQSTFRACGSAWTFDTATGQWYLHSFMPQQPDLNWDNPEVEAAMHDTLRFWMDRGIDGFRIDAMVKIAKDPLLRDHSHAPRRHDEDWDTINDRIRGIRRVLDEYPDRVSVGEVCLTDIHRFVSFINGGDQLHLAHNFPFLDVPWNAEAFRLFIDDFEAVTEERSWPAWFQENHDLPRVATRYDENGLGPARARAVALLLYTLRGTPFIYQGQELGLPNAVISADRVVDIDGRDPERAPIPWRRPSEAGPAAGFSTGEPWLPLVADAEQLCVQSQVDDPRSTLSLVRRLASLRERTPALQTGTQRTLEAGSQVLVWLREGDGERWLAAMNFATVPAALSLPAELPQRLTMIVSTDPDRGEDEVDFDAVTLRPGEAVLMRE